MKLLRFRIHNYRSIKDSGWQELSPDNITGIIGQNESGKTSILEALYSFYSGNVSEDVLRSDLTYPAVSCCFDISPGKFEHIMDEKLLPAGVQKYVRMSRTICLTRTWNEDLGSQVDLDGDELGGFFDQHHKANEEVQGKLQKKIDKQLDARERAISDYKQAEAEKLKEGTDLERYKVQLGEARKELRTAKTVVEKKQAEMRLKAATSRVGKAKKELEAGKKDADRKKKKAEEVIGHTKIVLSARQAEEWFEQTQVAMEEALHEVMKLQRILNAVNNEKERRGVHMELDIANDKYVRNLREFEQAKEEAIIKKNVACKVLSGKNPSTAEKEVKQEKPHIDPYFTKSEAGNTLFNFIPEFVLFEDFSSLLPNRIDLSDILDKNSRVEGCQAARNFLTVSGLTAKFFVESNTRILKQKIERLNKEVTLNFHDFWRQKIGKQNKITINFELEHYDHTYPEKSGHPYLEFWIKDRYERLYPKQRSRGVRWFLSFYLELKSSAYKEENMDSKIMLIDEPGLSLHARAQEDVLKVFDFVKDKIQILYSTHSPHLIDSRKLYRLLAVQRAVESDETSETRIFNAKSLTSASADTLSPIYTLIGSRLSEQQFIRQKNNIIIEDVATYYYLSTMISIMNVEKELYLLPASSVSNIETLVNLLMGWGLDFIVVTGGNPQGRKIHNELKKNICFNDEQLTQKILINTGRHAHIEDLFSTLDFKKHLLHQRIGIPESNSEYLRENNISRTIMASKFMNEVQDKRLTFSSFDEQTRENFERLLKSIERILK